MEQIEQQIRKDIVEVGRRVWLKNWVASNDGNISMRLGDEQVITTPTGVSKGFMTTDMLVKVDLDGNPVDGTQKPSSEIKIHLEAYHKRPDIRGFVHAHPPVSTAYAVAHIPLDFKTLPEIIITLGDIPIANYGTPSTTELSDSIAELVKSHDAILLANHGAITMGPDVMAAYYKMETVEHFASISLAAHQLGRMQCFTDEQIGQLEALRAKFGIKIGGD